MLVLEPRVANLTPGDSRPIAQQVGQFPGREPFFAHLDDQVFPLTGKVVEGDLLDGEITGGRREDEIVFLGAGEEPILRVERIWFGFFYAHEFPFYFCGSDRFKSS